MAAPQLLNPRIYLCGIRAHWFTPALSLSLSILNSSQRSGYRLPACVTQSDGLVTSPLMRGSIFCLHLCRVKPRSQLVGVTFTSLLRASMPSAASKPQRHKHFSRGFHQTNSLKQDPGSPTTPASQSRTRCLSNRKRFPDVCHEEPGNGYTAAHAEHKERNKPVRKTRWLLGTLCRGGNKMTTYLRWRSLGSSAVSACTDHQSGPEHKLNSLDMTNCFHAITIFN